MAWFYKLVYSPWALGRPSVLNLFALDKWDPTQCSINVLELILE